MIKYIAILIEEIFKIYYNDKKRKLLQLAQVPFNLSHIHTYNTYVWLVMIMNAVIEYISNECQRVSMMNI